MPADPTVVDAEAGYLSHPDAVDLLTLLTVTAYWRHRPRGVKAAELRKIRTRERRVSVGRKELLHDFEIRVQWPITAGTKRLAEDMRYFENALDLLCDRIRGPVGDHTHGGLFMSVAEAEDGSGRDADITVELAEPDVAEEGDGQLTATVRYSATGQHLTA